MKLDWKHWAFLIAASLGLIIAILAVSSWFSARIAQEHLTATIDAQKSVIQQAQTDREQHAKEDAARDLQTAATLQSWQLAVQAVRTPQQITGWSQSQLEDAIRGIQFSVPAPTAADPHPAAAVTIPEASLPGLRDTIEKCRECSLKLDTAQKDLDSRAAQMKLADTQIQALKTERDAAVTAAKGGSFWQRFKRSAKWLAIGAAAGAVAAKTVHR